jgi:hypothetical protein
LPSRERRHAREQPGRADLVLVSPALQRERPFERTGSRAICRAARKGQAFDNELSRSPRKPSCASRDGVGLDDEEHAWSVLGRCETSHIGRQLVAIRRGEISCSSSSEVHEVDDVPGIEREPSEVGRVTLSLDITETSGGSPEPA